MASVLILFDLRQLSLPAALDSFRHGPDVAGFGKGLLGKNGPHQLIDQH